MMRVYLAGPIYGEDAPGAWRDYTAEMIKISVGEDVEVINPLDLEVNLSDPGDVVHKDLEAISACDFLLAPCEKPSWGTAMELRHAAEIGVRTIGIKKDWADVSPWVAYHVDDKVATLDEAIEVLKRAPVGTAPLFPKSEGWTDAR